MVILYMCRDIYYYVLKDTEVKILKNMATCTNIEVEFMHILKCLDLATKLWIAATK